MVTIQQEDKDKSRRIVSVVTWTGQWENRWENIGQEVSEILEEYRDEEKCFKENILLATKNVNVKTLALISQIAAASVNS